MLHLKFGSEVLFYFWPFDLLHLFAAQLRIEPLDLSAGLCKMDRI